METHYRRTLLITALATLGAFHLTAEEPSREFRPRKVVQPFPVIENSPTVSADKAEPLVDPDDLVLGVVIAESARA